MFSRFLALIVAVAFVVFANGMVSTKQKAPSVGNLPRKMKRNLRSIKDAAAFEKIYTEEYETFLKVEARGAVYENLMEKIRTKARKLNITLKPEFGVKPIVVLPDLVDTAIAAGSFTTLVAAIKAAGLVETLKGPDRLTVFAPTDEAFAKLPEGTLEGLLADIPKLKSILTYHVISTSINSKKVAALTGQSVGTVNGKEVAIKVDKRDQTVTLDSAKVIKTDIKCSNGLIHVIDSVLIPKE
jgi:uncharacterized surface protein with fasciclin (FAS1) repeats